MKQLGDMKPDGWKGGRMDERRRGKGEAMAMGDGRCMLAPSASAVKRYFI